MENYIFDQLNSLLSYSDTLFYVLLFMSAIVENLFPPIPGDTITAFGAFLVGTGRLNYFLVYAATTMGSIVGFMLLFLLGRFLGKEFFMNRNYKFFSSASILSAELWFQKYGYLVVVGNRFLPGIRSVISIVSGISMLSIPRVLALSSASAAVWNFIWIHAGFMLGSNWDVVKSKMQMLLKTYNIAISIVLVTGLIIYLVYRIRSRRRERAGHKSET